MGVAEATVWVWVWLGPLYGCGCDWGHCMGVGVAGATVKVTVHCLLINYS